MKQKIAFTNLFLLMIMILLILPLFTTFNELLTRIVENIGVYKAIQDYIVPGEVKLVIVILHFFNVQAYGDSKIIFLVKGGFEQFRAQIIWSCIGWQSLLLYLLTLSTGLQGQWRLTSKVETMVLGILGTFWLNIFRLSSVYIIGYYFGKLPAVIFHNYFSTLAILLWLFFFWWFSYSFILEERAKL